MKKTLRVLIIGFTFILNSCGFFRSTPQISESATGLEQEFRAAWVATVANIDWPSKPGLSTAEQQQQALSILDTLQKLNFNALILQVRPQCDALYDSPHEPWSYYLTGEQGQPPQPYYDPLRFWVKEAHKRGLELHAWFNPFRAHHPKGGPITPSSVVKTHPELVKKLEHGYYWLNPALPESQRYSLQVILDVVRRYDIDGVHLDDYFYPYPNYNNGKDFPDQDTWLSYHNQHPGISKEQWRREAVNNFIKRLYQEVKALKPYVKVGISPFGIYRPGHPRTIKGFDQYRVLYADPRLWLQKGWLDYFSPQLYWPIRQIPQSFPVLLGWWLKQNPTQRFVWPGLFTSRFADSTSIMEIWNQIMIIRGFEDQRAGHIHFSVKAIMDSAHVRTMLKNGPYAQPAVIPAFPWLQDQIPQAPRFSTTITNDSLYVHWQGGHKTVIKAQYGKRPFYRIFAPNENQARWPLTFPLQADTLRLQLIEGWAFNRVGQASKSRKIKISLP